MANAPPLTLEAKFGQSRKLWPTSPVLQLWWITASAAASATAAAATTATAVIRSPSPDR